MVTFDWATWAANYPLKVERESAVAGLPEGISITRAGQAVFVSMEELDQIMAESLKTKEYVEEEIREGLRQSAAGEVVDLGSFEQYADEEI